jgi:hypothetical protein
VTPKRKKSFDPKSFLAQVGDGHSIGKYGKVRSSSLKETLAMQSSTSRKAR